MNTVPFLDLLHQYMPHGSSQDLRLTSLPKHAAFPGSFSVSPQRTASSPLGSGTSGSRALGAQSSSRGGRKRPLEEVGAPQESPRPKRPGACRVGGEPLGVGLAASQPEAPGAGVPGWLQAVFESPSWSDDEHRARQTHTSPCARTTVRAGSARESRAVTGATSVPPPP